ncbi:ABC transporter substrate-binding protein [Pelagibacterium lentulum]|uniref:Diguanylate phosphodiesterase n=1 Tax=Pelagibacterium lentulum TaxID=2029865 RepID=A0A916R7I1_9HYPH|nr:ABC transporter substrate-binding protein [Pelagibacterium lentulum]GGA43252.1 diguanylate phosphodiesterase [Pelagibacterium lentulum]
MGISRRAFLAQASALGAVASVGFNVNIAQAQQSDTITIALAARAPNGVNPQQTGLTGGDNWAIHQVFNTLVKADPGTFATTPEEFRPSLAESWESSDDARTWTYHLRRGVEFHGGYGEMTAADVLFTFGRQLDPSIVTNGKVLYQNIQGVEAPDDYTVVFTLERPDPLFNGSCIATLPANIISRAAFEERGDEFNHSPVGTGPYEVVDFSTDGIVLQAFEDHFDGIAATPNLRIAFIADTTARTLAFASGEVDMIEGVRSPGWIPQMQQRSADTIFDATAPGSFNSLHLNLTQAPLDDLRVRQAIRYAINNEQIAAAYGELATPMVGVIASQFPGSVSKESLPENLRYEHNIERARELLAEAGYPDGVMISAFTSQREDYASIMLIVQEQLRAAGIELDLQIIDHSTFHADNRSARNAMPLQSSSYPPVPTQPLLQWLSASAVVQPDGTGQNNFSHYGVAIDGVDDLLEQVQDEPDFERRIALVEEIEQKVLTDLPLLGIITLSYVIARNPRIDLGFEVQSGYAYWPLNQARVVS